MSQMSRTSSEDTGTGRPAGHDPPRHTGKGREGHMDASSGQHEEGK